MYFALNAATFGSVKCSRHKMHVPPFTGVVMLKVLLLLLLTLMLMCHKSDITVVSGDNFNQALVCGNKKFIKNTSK